MSRFSCIALGCPIPTRSYEMRVKRPPGCRFTDRCQVEAIDEPALSGPSAHLAVGQRSAPAPVATDLPVFEEDAPAVVRLLQRESPPHSAAVLLVVGARRFALTLPCLLGRHGVAANAFANDRTVSREHAELIRDGDYVIVRNVASSGNTLEVDDEDAPHGMAIHLAPGSHRLIFGTSFHAILEIGS